MTARLKASLTRVGKVVIAAGIAGAVQAIAVGGGTITKDSIVAAFLTAALLGVEKYARWTA